MSFSNFGIEKSHISFLSEPDLSIKRERVFKSLFQCQNSVCALKIQRSGRSLCHCQSPFFPIDDAVVVIESAYHC
jgi:hypothetical protein